MGSHISVWVLAWECAKMVPKDGWTVLMAWDIWHVSCGLWLFVCLRIPRNHSVLLHEMRWGYVSWHVLICLTLVGERIKIVDMSIYNCIVPSWEFELFYQRVDVVMSLIFITGQGTVFLQNCKIKHVNYP